MTRFSIAAQSAAKEEKRDNAKDREVILGGRRVCVVHLSLMCMVCSRARATPTNRVILLVVYERNLRPARSPPRLPLPPSLAARRRHKVRIALAR